MHEYTSQDVQSNSGIKLLLSWRSMWIIMCWKPEGMWWWDITRGDLGWGPEPDAAAFKWLRSCGVLLRSRPLEPSAALSWSAKVLTLWPQNKKWPWSKPGITIEDKKRLLWLHLYVIVPATSLINGNPDITGCQSGTKTPGHYKSVRFISLFRPWFTPSEGMAGVRSFDTNDIKPKFPFPGVTR